MGDVCQRREILERLLDHLPREVGWRRRIVEALDAPEVTVGVHLAILLGPYLTAIFQGRKTIESRFGAHRRPPYLCVEPDDFILLKRSGGPVVGIALAKSADSYQLSPRVLADIRAKFAYQLFALDDAFWESRAGMQYATLIELDEPIEIEPFNIAKRDRQGWVTYDRDRARGAQLVF